MSTAHPSASPNPVPNSVPNPVLNPVLNPVPNPVPGSMPGAGAPSGCPFGHGAAASPTVMDQLKARTRDAHMATEAIPFSAAMVERRLPRDRYVGQLAAYAVVHRSLDGHLAGSAHPALRAVWQPDLAKTPLLEADLRFFASDVAAPSSSIGGAIAAGERVAARIDELAAAQPLALLGFLYVLEGSTLGATILREHIAASHGLTLADGALGLAYYSPYGNAVMPHWKLFRERMNLAVPSAADQEIVVEAAREAFQRIGEILSALSVDL